jgi:hypothetical protein
VFMQHCKHRPKHFAHTVSHESYGQSHCCHDPIAFFTEKVVRRGVSRVWQAGHVPGAPLAGGAIWLGALVPMPNQVNKNFLLTY